jgi:electron transfer flavoprotein alpha subunit
MLIIEITEHVNASLKGSTLHTITAALQCDGEVHVLVAGHECKAAAKAASVIAGVGTVLVVEAPFLANGLAGNIVAQTVTLLGTDAYSHIVTPATAYGKNILPRVAAELDVGQISEIISVKSSDTCERSNYAGNAPALVQSADKAKVITVRSTGLDAATSRTGGLAAVIENINAAPDGGGSAFLSRALLASARPELTAAKTVVSGGRGMGSLENFKVLKPLAGKVGAAMGASRAAVDTGYVPHDWQIGQTGKIIVPQTYIAVGIFGVSQHLAVMEDSKVIVAVNKDPEAPIFAVAEYGIVGDLFDVAPRLADLLP